MVHPATVPPTPAVKEEELDAARADPFDLTHSVEQPAARTHTHTLSHSHTHSHSLSHTHSRTTKRADEGGRTRKEHHREQQRRAPLSRLEFSDTAVRLEFVPFPAWLVGFSSPVSCACRDPNPPTVCIAALCVSQTGTKCATRISDNLLWELTLRRLSKSEE